MNQFPINLPIIREPELTGCSIRFKLETPTFAVAVVLDQDAARKQFNDIKEFVEDIPPESAAQLAGVIQQFASTFLGAEVTIDGEPLQAEEPQGVDTFVPEVGERVRILQAPNVTGIVVEVVEGSPVVGVRIDDDVNAGLDLPEDRVLQVPPYTLQAIPEVTPEEKPPEESDG